MSDEEDAEMYNAVTVFEANNADTQALLLGEHDERRKLNEPEQTDDGGVVRARRYFDPVAVAELPEAMPKDEVLDWLDSRPDHDAFEEYDWDDHERKQYLDAIVSTRNAYRSMLSDVEQRLMEVQTVGTRAEAQLDEIREDIVDAISEGEPVSVNRLEESDETEAEA